MMRRMVIKEWKEKFGLVIFALAVLLLFFLAISVYAKDPDTLYLLVSTLLLIFPPLFALLLGASGFASEIQDGAWVYLFSRPVKKWQIWIAKYLSLLTILGVVFLLFALLIELHPALGSATDTYSFPIFGENISYGILAYILPLLLFTTAFSFSILSEKVHIVAFLAALTWTVLQVAVSQAGFFLFYREMSSSFLFLISLLSLVVPASFALASAMTLSRADFSQPRLRSWTFTKLSAVFVLASIVLVVLIGLVSGSLMKERYIFGLEVRNSALYFVTEKGFFKFDPAEGRTRKVARHPSFWGPMSFGGDKVAFVRYHPGGRGGGLAGLRIMNSDGTEEKSLVETENRDSPFDGVFIDAIRVSTKGDKVAFIARNVPKSDTLDLWTINSDGTGLRGYDPGIPDAYYYIIIGFEDSDRALFLLYVARARSGDRDGRLEAKLLRVDLESGEAETLTDRVRKPWSAFMPGEITTFMAGRVAFIQYDEAKTRESLTVYDPASGEKIPVYPEDSVTGFRWNTNGDKLAFLTAGSKLGIYFPAENQVVTIAELKGYDLRWPSQALGWTWDGRLILRRLEGKVSFLCILDANLTEQKALRLPFDTYYASRFWSAGQYAIAEDTEDHQLWGVDLTTDKWVRIY